MSAYRRVSPIHPLIASAERRIARHSYVTPASRSDHDERDAPRSTRPSRASDVHNAAPQRPTKKYWFVKTHPTICRSTCARRRRTHASVAHDHYYVITSIIGRIIISLSAPVFTSDAPRLILSRDFLPPLPVPISRFTRVAE